MLCNNCIRNFNNDSPLIMAARISQELLKSELNAWKKDYDQAKRDGLYPAEFGKFMNMKYNFQDPKLTDGTPLADALIIIFNNHVE